MKKKSQPKEACYYSAHIYLAEEIAKSADYLIKHLKSYPGIFDKGRRSSKYSIANENKWRKILAEIRDGFRLYAECDGDFYVWKDGKAPSETKSLDEMLEQMKDPDRPFKLVIDKIKLRKFQKAMALFAKYYEHLWD